MSHRRKKRKSTLERYDEVRAKYRKLSEIKEFGVQKHSFDWIIAKVAKECHYAETTVENIIFNRV